MRLLRIGSLVAMGAVLGLTAPDSAAQSAIPEEIHGTWQGRVETLVSDNFQTGASRHRFFLRTDRGTLELNVAPGLRLRAGQRVEVSGRAAGGRLTVTSVNTATAPPANSCPATGEQKVAIILASFPSKALLSSVTPQLMQSSLAGTGRTLDSFLRESSLGQTWAAGDVLGPFVLDADYFGQPLAVRDAALRAASPAADLTKYNRIVVVAPQGQTGMESGGMALLGCGPIDSPQGTLNASSIWLGAESMLSQSAVVDTLSHEIGHAFGLEHARAADYGSEPLGPTGQMPAAWDGIHDYGDSFSSMGRYSAQWAAPHKALLGWIKTGTSVQTVTSGGNFTLAPYEQAGGVEALRINRGTSPDAWLWLEYRQPVGMADSTLSSAAFAGALVHYEDPALTATAIGVDASLYTNLVNFHPAAAFFTDPTLHAGESWSDPYGYVTLTVTAASASGLNVSVAYAATPVCPSTVGSVPTFDAAGGNGAIAVTASGGCSWSPASSVSWISLGSASTQTGNGSVDFTVSSNPDVTPRWGKIAIGGAFVVVTQAGGSGWVTINPVSATVPAEGGNGEIAVAASAPDVAWAFQSNAAWITDLECDCGTSVGPATLRYTVAANTGPDRTGTINIGNAVFTVTQSGGSDAGSLTWNLQAPADAPNSRAQLAMAPFGRSGQAILYGGSWDTTTFAETWRWDGTNWTLLQPANNPGVRTGHAMAYDEARKQIVLFGGFGAASTYTGDTWVWDGTNWQQRSPAVSPPARAGHAMAYDAATGTVILFGGTGNSGDTNDTWAWDGSNWTQLTSADNPLPRTGHALAYDAAHGQIVLFGGMHGYGPPTWYSDTWLFDGNGWHQAYTANPPAARAGHVLAYHPGLQTVVLIAGAGGKSLAASGTWYYDFHRDIWTWDGASWTQQFPDNQPGPAYAMGAAYNATTQRLTVHVGDDLTCDSRGPKTYVLTGARTATSKTSSRQRAPLGARPK